MSVVLISTKTEKHAQVRFTLDNGKISTITLPEIHPYTYETDHTEAKLGNSTLTSLASVFETDDGHSPVSFNLYSIENKVDYVYNDDQVS